MRFSFTAVAILLTLLSSAAAAPRLTAPKLADDATPLALVPWAPDTVACFYSDDDGALYRIIHDAGVSGIRATPLDVPADDCRVASASSGEVWLFTRSGQQVAVRRARPTEGGWSKPTVLYEAAQPLALGSAVVDGQGHPLLTVRESVGEGRSLVRVLSPDRPPETAVPAEAVTSEPILAATPTGLAVYLSLANQPNRFLRTVRSAEGAWSPVGLVNLPFMRAGESHTPLASIVPMAYGRIAAAGNDHVLRPRELALRFSYDGGRTWPGRLVLDEDAPDAATCLMALHGGHGRVAYRDADGSLREVAFTDSDAVAPTSLSERPEIWNVLPTLDISAVDRPEAVQLPVPDYPVVEHVRASSPVEWPEGAPEASAPLSGVAADATTPIVKQGNLAWVGTKDGLYSQAEPGAEFSRHSTYGVDGPPSNVVAGLAVDSRDTLWVATPAGLASRDANGAWNVIRGREGLPWEELTAVAIDSQDRLWLGSTRGLIHYQPYAEGRRWYYRAGERYLLDDRVSAVALSDDGRSVFARTDKGVGRVDAESVTLLDKAEYLENRLNERHRRLGMPSPANYDDPYAMASWTHPHQPSDGLWTGYHATALSLAYSLTQNTRYLDSARQSMEALYLLQNVTGIKGLVARSVVTVDEPAAADAQGKPNWHPTADGRYLWRDDVSSDQIDGHFLAFYAYFEHVAQFDPKERERVEAQVRQVLDYILDNGYRIIDHDGEPTLWGWWEPERVNRRPEHYLESGLYSLMMLSFLKTAYYITGDNKYMDHFRSLAQEHGYLSNLLLQKKIYPDEINHSDDQLSAVAFYPILQLEHDPFVRDIHHRAARRHDQIERPERNSLFSFVYASIDPEDADVLGALQTLREMPRDRRNWAMLNSHRADVVLRRPNRRANPVLLDVLPADERHFERWNQDPFEPDIKGDGRTEGSGEHYLLPYWLARYHGLLAAPQG